MGAAEVALLLTPEAAEGHRIVELVGPEDETVEVHAQHYGGDRAD
jgi:hypothetical protein